MEKDLSRKIDSRCFMLRHIYYFRVRNYVLFWLGTLPYRNIIPHNEVRVVAFLYFLLLYHNFTLPAKYLASVVYTFGNLKYKFEMDPCFTLNKFLQAKLESLVQRNSFMGRNIKKVCGICTARVYLKHC